MGGKYLFFIQNLVNESLKYVKILKKNFCYFSSPPSAVPKIFRQRCAPFAPFPPLPHVPARLAENENYGRQPTKRRSREKKLSARRSAPRIRQGGGSYNFKRTGAIFRFSETHARGIKIGEKSANQQIQAARATCCAFFCARAYRRELSPRLSPRATSAF